MEIKTLTQQFAIQMEPELKKLEGLRKQTFRLVLKQLMLAFALPFLIGVGLVFGTIRLIGMAYENTSDTNILWVGFVLLAFVLVGMVGVFFKKKAKVYRKHFIDSSYVQLYMKQLIEGMLPFWGGRIAAHQQHGIAEEDFTNSGLPLFSNPAEYHASPALVGVFKQSAFQFGEVHVQQYVNNEKMDLFRGSFCIIDLLKKTASNTIVYPDKLKYFSKMLVGSLSEEEAFRERNYQRIKIEDLDFERYFEVYGTDQIASRYLLSTALIQRILSFRKKTGKSIMLSLKEDKAFVAIYYPRGKKLFRPPLWSSSYAKEPLENYMAEIKFMLDFIQDLNINSKI